MYKRQFFGFLFLLCFLLLPTSDARAQRDSLSGAERRDSILSPIRTDLEDILALVDTVYYKERNLEMCGEMIFHLGIGLGVRRCLDRYSRYFTNEEYDRWSSVFRDSIYVGVGVKLSREFGLVFVTPLHDSVAAQTGLRYDDILLSIDSVNVKWLPFDSVVSLFRGEEGTAFTVTVRRDTTTIGPLTLLRAKRKVTNVVYRRIGTDLAHVRLYGFLRWSPGELRRSLRLFRSERRKGFVLDLRGNPGGSVVFVIDIVNFFAPDVNKVIFTKINENTGRDEVVSTDSVGEFSDIPFVILADRSSSSGSDIFAGVMRAWDRAQLVGDTTAGKGVAQSSRRLRSGNALKLTVYEVLVGEDRIRIHGIGVPPDFFVRNRRPEEGKPFIDEELNKALEVLRGILRER